MIELNEILQQCWQSLEQGAVLADHPFHLAVIANFSSRGTQLRTIVLRHADEQTRRLTFHTDSRSRKAKELLISGQLSWLFFNPRTGVQLRARSPVKLHHRDSVSTEQWDKVPKDARLLYSNPQTPGEPLAKMPGTSLGSEEAFGNFLVVHCDVTHIDWLLLDPKGHQRVEFSWDGKSWNGQRIVP